MGTLFSKCAWACVVVGVSDKDYYGHSWLQFEDEKVPIKALDFDVSELSTEQIHGMEPQECDKCGKDAPPTALIYVGSSDLEKAGKYHISCWEDKQ